MRLAPRGGFGYVRESAIAVTRIVAVTGVTGAFMTTELLTYRELADRLGVKIESARKTVQRRGWKRIIGNDQIARVVVPVEYLPGPPDDTPDMSPQVALLEGQIEALRGLLSAETRRAETAEADRDAWRAQAQRSLWNRLFG